MDASENRAAENWSSEDGIHWQPATPIGPQKVRHWPWLQRIMDWIWRATR